MIPSDFNNRLRVDIDNKLDWIFHMAEKGDKEYVSRELQNLDGLLGLIEIKEIKPIRGKVNG